MNSNELLEQAILKTIGYFGYFNYPLSTEQIVQFLTVYVEDIKQVDIALTNLLNSKKVQQIEGFYSLASIGEFFKNRNEGEHRFKELEPRIHKSCRRLSKFPFVKFVGISGSLSKNYAPENADIDFFIITTKNRLWICRTILHVFKKISFVKGSQHWYCMNYFIDETAMEIEEQNYFTAIELSTLKAVIDDNDYYKVLIDKNLYWIKSILPNFTFVSPLNCTKPQKSIFNKIFSLLSNDFLNLQLKNWTDKKWRKKWKKKNYPQVDYELAFKTRINISKNHLHNYQKKMLEHLDGIK